MATAWRAGARRLLLVAPALLSLVLATPTFTTPPPERFKNPLGLAVDQTGRTALVALYSATALAEVELATGKVLREMPMTAAPALAKRLPPPPEDGRARFSSLPPDAARVQAQATQRGVTFLAYQRPRANVPATQVSQGWVFTNALTIHGPVSRTLTLDEPQRGYADPSDLAVSPDGRRLYLACAGADLVLVLDQERLFQRPATSPAAYRVPGEFQDDLTMSRRFVVARLPTQANPRRLGLSGDGKTLVVSNHLADSLTVIDTASLKVLRHIPLGGPKPDAARRGAVLFHSSRLTFQGQFTCASCHPGGGSDGLNWDLERDGIGNFKNTKALWSLKETAPYGWHGSSPTVADRVRGTLRTLHRHEPTKQEVTDLTAYLETLAPPTPPPLSAEQQSAVERGRKLFEGKAQCRNCHHRAGFDDGLTHDVGTRGPTDPDGKFDTPGLRAVSHTPPYLHDGRAATLEEVFTKYNPSQRHGAAQRLSNAELADLVEYLKSL